MQPHGRASQGFSRTVFLPSNGLHLKTQILLYRANRSHMHLLKCIQYDSRTQSCEQLLKNQQQGQGVDRAAVQKLISFSKRHKAIATYTFDHLQFDTCYDRNISLP